MDALSLQFEAIKRHYRQYASEFKNGRSDEWCIPAYAWKNPSSGIRLSPIEEFMWEEIRLRNAIFYPQWPADRFFIDFANPHAMVGIECDGEAFHRDVTKDRIRQEELEGLGWTIYRIKGWACNRREYEIMTEHGVREVPSPGARLMSEIVCKHPVVRGLRPSNPRPIGEILRECFAQMQRRAAANG